MPAGAALAARDEKSPRPNDDFKLAEIEAFGHVSLVAPLYLFRIFY
jgi:hypothetical protein